LLALVVATAHASADGCAEWARHVEQLEAASRTELDEQGAFADGEWILLSAKVVSDCGVRAHFSSYLGSVVRGVDPVPSDLAVVRKSGKKLVHALAAIWPTKGRAFPGADGALREELSNILVRPELDLCVVRPLMEKILREDGMSGEATYALLTRPDASLLPLVEVRAGVSGDDRPSRANIFALAVLQRLGEDVGDRLKALAERNDLTPAMNAAITTLRARLRAQELPEWDDVSDLETE
jgi:hypothetical protein